MITKDQFDKLKNNQVVRYRVGIAGRKTWEWDDWKTGPIYVQRLKKASNGRPKGTLLIVLPMNDCEAEFTPHDFCKEEGAFMKEQYLFEIDGENL